MTHQCVFDWTSIVDCVFQPSADSCCRMTWYLSFPFIPKIKRDLRNSSSRVSKNGRSEIFHFNLYFRSVWFQDCLNKFSPSFTMLSCFPEYSWGCATWMTNFLLLPTPPSSITYLVLGVIFFVVVIISVMLMYYNHV